jgi:putative membrane protein
MGMTGWGGMGFGGFFGLFGMLLFLGLLALLVYLSFKALEGQEGRKDRDKALETLRLRYAKGELDEETFRQLKRELEGHLARALPGGTSLMTMRGAFQVSVELLSQGPKGRLGVPHPRGGG